MFCVFSAGPYTTGIGRRVPSPAEVRVGTSGGAGTWGAGGLTSGSLAVAAANTLAAVNVTGLDFVAPNDLWVVAVGPGGYCPPRHRHAS